MAVMRIQKKSDFAHVAKSEKYKNRLRESSIYRKIMQKGLKKKVGVVNEIIANHLESNNKGYPEGCNYKTYGRRKNTTNRYNISDIPKM